MSFKPANRNKNNEEKIDIVKSTLPKIEVINLPSKFKPYKSNKISFSPYTFGEINRFNQSKVSQSSKLKELLKGITCDFDSGNLTFADFLYINLLRKISTFGTKKFNVVIPCPICGSKNNIVFSESDLEFDEIEVDLPVTAILSNNRELVFSPLTVNNFLALLDKGLEKDLCAGLAIQVTNMSYEEAFEIIDKSYGDDSAILEEIDKIMYHGLKSIKATCKNCESKLNVSLDGGQTIVYPFRERPFSARDALRFGIQKTG